MSLPLLLSVPHAGLHVPQWLQAKCLLNEAQIVQDGDEGAAEIYALADNAAAFVSTDIARAVVDLNRAEDDRRKDGVIKTHTCYDVPIWRDPLTAEEEQRLLEQHYRPYHRQLTEFATRADLKLAVDCHTMADVAPPVAPDPGLKRPWVCLGDVHGATLPEGWIEVIAESFRDVFGDSHVAVNDPFAGGYITQTHGREMPWLQLELSRGPWMTSADKRRHVLAALSNISERITPRG